MRKILIISLGLLITPAGYAEDDSGMITSFGIGINHLEFNNRSGNTSIARYATLNVGIAAYFKNIYGSLNGELFGYDIDPKQENTNDTEETHRNDYSFSVGYNATQNFKIFAGHAISRTVFTRTSFARLHKDSGPFAGFGVTFPSDKGAFGFNIAYADFKGELPAGDGKTTGYSYGISWTTKYNESSNITVGLKSKNYLFELDDSDDETEKDVTTLNISYQF